MTEQEIQDQFDRMQVNIQTLLDILDPFNDVVSLYLTRAINYVKAYCNLIEIPTDLETVIEDIAIFKYRNKGIENIQSENKGSLSESYRQSLPSETISELNRFRRMSFI